MLQSLLGEIVEMLLSVAGAALVRACGLESIVELVTAMIGLSFIAIGLAAWWFGWGTS